MTNKAHQKKRYGRGYLRHEQSWRYPNEFEDVAADGSLPPPWRLCRDPTEHACLEHYPSDGNVDFHPETFTEWEVDLPSLNN